MRPLSLLLLLALLPAAGVAAEPSAPAYLVVVHPNNPVSELRRSKLADLFLRKAAAWDSGVACKPVDQSSESAARKTFSEEVLKRSVPAVIAYWQQRVFSGRGAPPPQLGSDDEVAAYVKANEGAVGYVSAKANLAGLKVLRTVE